MKKIISICLILFLFPAITYADFVPYNNNVNEQPVLALLLITGLIVLMILIFSIICLKQFFKKEIDNEEVEVDKNAKESI